MTDIRNFYVFVRFPKDKGDFFQPITVENNKKAKLRFHFKIQLFVLIKSNKYYTVIKKRKKIDAKNIYYNVNCTSAATKLSVIYLFFA